MNCDILKIVSGNDFATQMTITALDAAGNVIENFSLEDSTDVVVKYTLAGSSHAIEAYDYNIEGNDITIQWSDLTLGKYGFEIEGKFNGYSWRSAARFIFQIVADNASANIPDGVLVDGVYKLSDWLRLLSGTGGGGKQVQADWTETDTNSPAYIQNKPNLAPVATSGSYNDLTDKPTIPVVTGKADKVSGAVAGDFAGLDENGNLTDSGKNASDFATAAQGAKADTALQQSDVDSTISSTSEHPIQNKAVKEAIDNKLSEVVINNIPSESVTIINDLIIGGATNVLSAEQGKAINDIIRTDIVVDGENLFDGTINTGAPWTGFISQKYIDISVEASTKYSINLGVAETPQYNQIAYYNSSDTKISNTGIAYSSGKASFTTPENCIKARILVSNISSLRNCYIVKGNDTNNYVPNKYLKLYEPRNEADSRYSEILTSLGTKLSAAECLNKTYFSEKKRGVPWSDYATCDYYDIPRELFDDVLFLWETNNTSLTSTLVIRLIDNNDNLLNLDTGYSKLRLNLSYGIARISITAENIKTIRLAMYAWTDAQINDLFIGSDKDADYTSWEWVKLRTVPPVSGLPYYGTNEDLARIVGTKPTFQGVYKKISSVNLLNVNDVEIIGAAQVSPYNPLYRSNYIAVDADTLYTLSIDGVVSSYSYGILFYDSDKEYISSTNNHRHTTPSNCAFVRIDITNHAHVGSVDGTEQWQYQKGEITAYESYYQYVNNNITTPLSGKRIAVIGDSFTASGVWFSVMCNKLGAFGKYNAAESGGRWSDTAEPNSAYEQAQSIVNSGISMDYVLCVLGVNDYTNNIPLGDIVYSDDIEAMDLSTITGGIQACIAYLRNNMPSAVIKIGYTPAGQFYNPVYPNLTTIIERMKEIALLYGVDYIETRCLGLSKYITDQHDYWESINGGHPVGDGLAIIGDGMARLMACNL